MRKLIPFILLLTLTGCIGDNTQRNNNQPTITNPINHPPTIELQPVSSDKLELELMKNKEATIKDVKESQNVMSQNINSNLGIGLGKVGEEVNALKVSNLESIAKVTANVDSVLKMQNTFDTKIGDINTKFEAQIRVSAELKAQVGDITTKFEVSIKLNNEMNTKIGDLNTTIKDLQLKVNANAQAGIGNKLDQKMEEIHQDIKAGGNVTQFTREMLEALKSANNTTILSCIVFAVIFALIIAGACIIISLLFKRGKDHAEKTLKFFQGGFVRAMGKLNAADADGVYHDALQHGAKKD